MFLLRIFATTLLIYLTAHLIPSIAIINFWPTAIIAGVVFWLITKTIKPLLKLITLPFTLITFGLFSLVINAFVFWLASHFVNGFTIQTLSGIFLGSIAMSLGSWLINKSK